MALHSPAPRIVYSSHARQGHGAVSQTLFKHRSPSSTCHQRIAQLHRTCQPTAAHRYFDIRIQSSWGNGPSSNSAETSVGSRWWSSGSSEAEADRSTSSSPSGIPHGRFGSLFNNNRDNSSPNGNGSNGSSTSAYSSGYSYGASSSDSSSSSSTSSCSLLAGNAAPWVMVALVPTMLWCITWCFTGGMVTLANTSMSGMCAVARLLFPSLPVKGVGYEDIAVSLVKALHSGTDQPSTWTRPGLLAPAWFMRGVMGAMFNLATASSSMAASLIPNQQWLAVSGVSQSFMYISCLLLMLPLGAGLSSLSQRLLQQLRRHQIIPANVSLPSINLPFSLPRWNDNTSLALKLAGVLAWPCISAAAVLQPSVVAQQTLTANFTVATLQVAVCTLLLVLLLMVAVTAGRFVSDLGKQTASTQVVQDFGYQVGLLCALAGLLNVAQIGLGLASGQLPPNQLAMPVISTLILGRVVWSIWRLWRIEAATPSMWLQLLTLTPDIKLPTASAS